MTIKQRHIEISMAILIWLLLVIDNYYSSFWVDVVEATLRVTLLAASFEVFKYYYSRLKNNSLIKIRLTIWFLGLVSGMMAIDYFYG